MKGSKRDRQNVNNMNKAMWEDCSNGWMCSKCFRDSTYDYYKCQHCGCIMLNGT